MREILFRGKRKENGEWVYGNYAVTDNNEKQQHFIFQNKAFEFEVDPETVGQYTGLTDKNGKKIFEGDIVEYINSSPCKIDYIDGQFVMMWKNFYRNFERVYDDQIEVIGNIYDNPELLEV